MANQPVTDLNGTIVYHNLDKEPWNRLCANGTNYNLADLGCFTKTIALF